MTYPDVGDIIPGSGGIRKARWKQRGRGKRGGVRIIYFWKRKADEIWLLTIYSKSERATIPSHVLRSIAEELGNE